MARHLIKFVRKYTSVSIEDGGKRLMISSSQKDVDYHALWLRHNCQCEDCISTSNQKTVTHQQLKGCLRINHAQIENGQLLIQWKSSNSSEQQLSHSGSICLQWLKENSYSAHALKTKSSEMEPIIGAQQVSSVEYRQVMDSDEGLWNWLYHLNVFGFCIVTGMPSSEDEIKKVCGRIGNLQNTIYGEVFDVRSDTNPINIAYTTSHLDLHMDLAYYQSPPGLQALHCLRFDDCVRGGETILLDLLAVVEHMRRQYPKQFETLTKVPATFQKIHFDRNEPVAMVYRRPHIVLDRYGHVVKVNWSPSIRQVVKVNWSPLFEGPLSIPHNEVEEYYDAYVLFGELIDGSPNRITHRLREGEMIVFNNQRILHGRHGFNLNGGTRHLRGCYLNIDEFASKFTVLSKLLNKTETTKHVLNESFYLS